MKAKVPKAYKSHNAVLGLLVWCPLIPCSVISGGLGDWAQSKSHGECPLTSLPYEVL